MDSLRQAPIKRVVLVNPPMRVEQIYGSYSEWGSVSPPTGLCYIAAMLRKNGFDVLIVDAEALRLGCQEAAQVILERQPQVVGIACKTLWVENAHLVARLLKEKLPNCRSSPAGTMSRPFLRSPSRRFLL